MSSTTSENAECCPKFDPEPWKGRTFDWKEKLFVTDHTTSFLYMPLNMGKVITRMQKSIENAGAGSPDFLMLSSEKSPWRGDHYIPVEKEVPGIQNIKLSGKFITKVFEGPYSKAKNWYQEMNQMAMNAGSKNPEIFMYYTTCPKCAKKWGKNYVVGFAKVD